MGLVNWVRDHMINASRYIYLTYSIALGGYQNARGYHRQPDMTAKKFITHPIGGQLYLTGDIVRVSLEDCSVFNSFSCTALDPSRRHLRICGTKRRSNQTGRCAYRSRAWRFIDSRVLGIRVELSEISAPLKDCHPLTRDAVTMQLSRPE